VVAHWTRTHGVMGSYSSKIVSFFQQVRFYFKSYKELLFPKFCIFRKSMTIHHCMAPDFPKIYVHTSLYGPIASGASVDPTSQVCFSTMLLLPIVGNLKVRFYGSPQWHSVHSKFHPNPSSGSRVESWGQTDMTSPNAFIPCTSCKQRTKRGLTKLFP
jgi:hypothetical protein